MKNKNHRKKSVSNRKKSIPKKKSVKFAPENKEIIIQDLDLLDKDKHIPVKVKLLNPKVNIKIHKPVPQKPREAKKIQSFGQTLEEDPFNLKQKFIDDEIEKLKNNNAYDYTRHEFNMALKEFVNLNPAVYWRNNKLIIDEMYDEILYKVSKFFESKKIIKEKEENSLTRKLANIKGNYTRFTERYRSLYRKFQLYLKTNKTFEMYENIDNDIDRFINSQNNVFDEQNLKDIKKETDYKDKIQKLYDAKKALLMSLNEINDTSQILKPTKKIKVKKPSDTSKPIIRVSNRQKKPVAASDTVEVEPEPEEEEPVIVKTKPNKKDTRTNKVRQYAKLLLENKDNDKSADKTLPNLAEVKQAELKSINEIVIADVADKLLGEVLNEQDVEKIAHNSIEDLKPKLASTPKPQPVLTPTPTTTPKPKTQPTTRSKSQQQPQLDPQPAITMLAPTKTTTKTTTKTSATLGTLGKDMRESEQNLIALQEKKLLREEKGKINRTTEKIIRDKFNTLNTQFKGKFAGKRSEMLKHAIENNLVIRDREENKAYLERIYDGLYPKKQEVPLTPTKKEEEKLADDLMEGVITDNLIGTSTPIKSATPYDLYTEQQLLDAKKDFIKEIDHVSKDPDNSEADKDFLLNDMNQQLNLVTAKLDELKKQGKGRYKKGGNFLKNAFNKVKHILFNTGSPQTDKIVKEYGDYVIKNAVIHRKPVDKILKDVINVISLGQFNNYKKSYDEVFHLSAVFEVEKNGQMVYLMTEKRPNIFWSKVNSLDDYNSTDSSRVNLSKFQPCTLSLMIDKTKQIMGSDFNTYNAKTGNHCQKYILSLFEAFYQLQRFPLPAIIRNYIYQDMAQFITEFAGDTAKKVTDLGAMFNRVIGGKRRLKKLKNI